MNTARFTAVGEGPQVGREGGNGTRRHGADTWNRAQAQQEAVCSGSQLQLPNQRVDPDRQSRNLYEVKAGHLSHDGRQIGALLADRLLQLLDVGRSAGSDHPEFRRLAAQSIDELVRCLTKHLWVRKVTVRA